MYCVMFFVMAIICVETVFGCIVQYYLVGLNNDNYGQPFAFFILVLLVYTVVMSLLFRVVLVLCHNYVNVGVSVYGVILLMSSLFSGFILPRGTSEGGNTSVPDYWQWAYYINPTAWTLSALAINEYKGTRDDGLVEREGESGGERFGEVALTLIGHSTESRDKWNSLLVLIGMYVGLTVLLDILLRVCRRECVYAIPLRERGRERMRRS